jgi:hypothetical protein
VGCQRPICVVAGRSVSEDARERAYDPTIHHLNEFFDGCAGQARA